MQSFVNCIQLCTLIGSETNVRTHSIESSCLHLKAEQGLSYLNGSFATSLMISKDDWQIRARNCLFSSSALKNDGWAWSCLLPGIYGEHPQQLKKQQQKVVW